MVKLYFVVAVLANMALMGESIFPVHEYKLKIINGILTRVAVGHGGIRPWPLPGRPPIYCPPKVHPPTPTSSPSTTTSTTSTTSSTTPSTTSKTTTSTTSKTTPTTTSKTTTSTTSKTTPTTTTKTTPTTTTKTTPTTTTKTTTTTTTKTTPTTTTKTTPTTTTKTTPTTTTTKTTSTTTTKTTPTTTTKTTPTTTTKTTTSLTTKTTTPSTPTPTDILDEKLYIANLRLLGICLRQLSIIDPSTNKISTLVGFIQIIAFWGLILKADLRPSILSLLDLENESMLVDTIHKLNYEFEQTSETLYSESSFEILTYTEVTSVVEYKFRHLLGGEIVYVDTAQSLINAATTRLCGSLQGLQRRKCSQFLIRDGSVYKDRGFWAVSSWILKASFSPSKFTGITYIDFYTQTGVVKTTGVFGSGPARYALIPSLNIEVLELEMLHGYSILVSRHLGSNNTEFLVQNNLLISFEIIVSQLQPVHADYCLPLRNNYHGIDNYKLGLLHSDLLTFLFEKTFNGFDGIAGYVSQFYHSIDMTLGGLPSVYTPITPIPRRTKCPPGKKHISFTANTPHIVFVLDAQRAPVWTHVVNAKP